MITNKDIIPLFPEAVLYATTLDVNSNEILNFCKKSSFNFTESSLEELCNCYASKDFKVFDKLNDLKNKIEEHIKYYLFEIFKYKIDYKFLNSWITKVDVNGYSQPHTHNNTLLSGVYYPVGDKNFKIKFIKKDQGFFDIDANESNSYNCRYMIMDILHNNTLILFPSSLKHNIEKNKSNTERYSIAFNINPKGVIGTGDSKVYF